jgi:hypothetical protein
MERPGPVLEAYKYDYGSVHNEDWPVVQLGHRTIGMDARQPHGIIILESSVFGTFVHGNECFHLRTFFF